MSKLKAKHEQELQQFILSKEWKKALVSCEDWELDAAQEGGVPSYCPQLLLYYLTNDVVNARFLWKRIPSSFKSGKPELTAVWKIGQALWTKNYEEIYKAIHGYQWNEPQKTLVQSFLDSFRVNTFLLLSKAYQVISVADAAVYLGFSQADVVKHTTQQGWIHDASNNLLAPKRLVETKDQSTSLVHLQQLTEYFCFLEN